MTLLLLRKRKEIVRVIHRVVVNMKIIFQLTKLLESIYGTDNPIRVRILANHRTRFNSTADYVMELPGRVCAYTLLTVQFVFSVNSIIGCCLVCIYLLHPLVD